MHAHIHTLKYIFYNICVCVHPNMTLNTAVLTLQLNKLFAILNVPLLCIRLTH